MPRIQTSITINRPIEQVFAFVTDFGKAVQWQPGIVEAKMTSTGPAGMGSTYKWVQQIVGQKMDTTGQVTAWNPPNGYDWKSLSGPFPMTGGVKLQAEGNGTLVTQFADAEPGGFFKLAEGMLMKQIEGQFSQGLKNLKELLEK